MSAETNKRIVKNTIFLYIRTFVSMIISLYTSRKILEALGVSDFGIQNVVGGVITMLTFLNGSMSVATQRFLSVELGRKDKSKYNRIFNMAVLIHIGLAVLVLIAAETIGLWFVNTYLNIPAGRMTAANWVYQASILSTMIISRVNRLCIEFYSPVFQLAKAIVKIFIYGTGVHQLVCDLMPCILQY